eukprot:m51a1_g14396 hypothetical protein (133) ;mRNA; r:347902-348300
MDVWEYLRAYYHGAAEGYEEDVEAVDRHQAAAEEHMRQCDEHLGASDALLSTAATPEACEAALAEHCRAREELRQAREHHGEAKRLWRQLRWLLTEEINFPDRVRGVARWLRDAAAGDEPLADGEARQQQRH